MDIDAINRQMKMYIAESEIAGAVLRVRKDEEIVYQGKKNTKKGNGSSDDERRGI